MTYDKQTYERLKTFSNGNDDEAELCDLIEQVILEKQQVAARAYHAAYKESPDDRLTLDHYWESMILDRAASYVEDWKESIIENCKQHIRTHP